MEIITTHLHADFDCLASMAGAAKLYPEALLVFPGSQEKNVRDYLADVDTGLPLRKLRGLSLDHVTRVIVVDACARERIGLFGELADDPKVDFHIYDHHPQSTADLPASVSVIRPRGSSATVIVEELREKGIALSPTEATLLALGIYEDTGSLVYPSVTVHDFAAASWLLEQGADLSVVGRFVNRDLDPAQVETLNDLLHSLESRVINGVPVAVGTASAPPHIGDVSTVAQKLMEIEDLPVYFALVRIAERIHMVARSRIEGVNAGDVARAFGGGGHATAASATIRDKTLPQVLELTWQRLEEVIDEPPNAGDIMAPHVISCSPDDPIEKVENLLTRHDIAGLPVVDGDGRVAGLLTRQIVEKAIYHGLADHRVEEYMIREFSQVHPDTPAMDLEELILGRRQKLAPVTDRTTGKLVGLVTRGMALDRLYGDRLKAPAVLPGGRRREPLQRDMGGLMKERLPASILSLFHTIRDVADKNGYTAYVVGGFVRDLLLRIPNLDVDIVVEGDGVEFGRLLAARLDARVRVHHKFKTAVVIMPDGFKIDVATARIEYYAHPAALPTVESGALRSDLFRRDFSINAMAIRLNGKRPDLLIDYFGGQTDIKDHAIRVLHNLSFVEDPTRAFRAVRFEGRYGFTLGRQTLSLLKSAVASDLFHRLSGGRLFSEIRQILAERRPIGAIRRLKELGLLRFVHPGQSFGGPEERLMEKMGDMIAWLSMARPGEKIEPWLARLMVFVDAQSDEEINEMIDLYPQGRKDFESILLQRKLGKALHRDKALTASPLAPSALCEILAPFTTEGLLYLAARSDDTKVTDAVRRYLTELRDVVPLVTGEELIDLGVAPSRQMGRLLEAIRAAQLDGKVSSRSEAMALAQKLIEEGPPANPETDTTMEERP